MEIFKSISELLSKIDSIFENDWIFTNLEKWKTTPLECPLYLVRDEDVDNASEDETFVNPGGIELPIALEHENVTSWMLIEILHGVLLNLRKSKPNISVNDFVYAINYYREYDDFYDPA